MNWQPIETAPRDGSLFLIVNSNDINSYTLAWWAKDERPYHNGFAIYEEESGGIEDYTHWMLLPPPPKENEK